MERSLTATASLKRNDCAVLLNSSCFLSVLHLSKKAMHRFVSVPLGTNSDCLKDPVKISIPRYVLRGQGKDEHFEFEIKITVMDETWTVFRRYSRFREMHKTLKMKFPELAALEFPPKKLFGNRDERMVAERQSHLEGHTLPTLQTKRAKSSVPTVLANRIAQITVPTASTTPKQSLILASRESRELERADPLLLSPSAETDHQMQKYLKNFFRVMMSPSSGSPLRTDSDSEGGLQLSKHAICDFSPFFKKGVFDYSSHGTG